LINVRSEALHPMAQPSQADGPAGLFQWLAQMQREIEPTHLELQPLDEGATVEMIDAILAEPAADFAQWIYAETHGQPFYLMETLKDLLERGALHPKRRGQDGWAFTVDDEHNLGQAVRVPSTVRAVIRARLQRLSPNAFSLLAAAAILEQQIHFEYLCAIANLPAEAALPALDELISGRLLLEIAQAGAASAYPFANDMIRDVVYTEAGDARRRLFHRRSLEALETTGVSAAVLAHHALAAGLGQAACHHSLEAGREALRLSAINEAIVHFEQARQLAREFRLPQADARDLYAQLNRAYQLSGQADRAAAIQAEFE